MLLILKKTKETLWALLLSIVIFCSLPQQVSADISPNILLIYVDDLGYGDLGSFGHPVIQTPRLDRLAKEGVRLTSYYAPSALCSPSRAGLLTGRTPYRTGIKSWIPEDTGIYLHEAEETLPELLKEQGYSTALIGKWHLNSDLGSKSEPQPLDHGFDYAMGHNAFQIPNNHNPTNLYRNGKAMGEQRGYTADIYAEAAINWLRQQEPGKPFFIYLSMAEPHTAIANPPEYNRFYKAFTRGEVVPSRSGEGIHKDQLIPRGPGEYYANITYMDAQLGRVLDELDLRGLRDNTIVVFTSDNGPVTSDWRQWWEINSYGSTGGLRGRKHKLYEGGIKVPAIVRYPKVIKAGTVSDQPAIGMDLFVTLAEMAGAEVPDDRPIDGIDIQPLLRGKSIKSRELFWAMPSDSGAEYVIRKGRWKLLADSELKPLELFDLQEDPLEFFNLAATNPGRVQQLLRLMTDKVRSIENDPYRPKLPKRMAGTLEH